MVVHEGALLEKQELITFAQDAEALIVPLSNRVDEDVPGRTIGIVGFGRIGQALARRAKGFSMTVSCPHEETRG